MTDYAALMARLRDQNLSRIYGEAGSRTCNEAAAAIEAQSLRIDGYKGSRDYAIDLLAKALGVEADKVRGVEYYARLASEKIEALQRLTEPDQINWAERCGLAESQWASAFFTLQDLLPDVTEINWLSRLRDVIAQAQMIPGAQATTATLAKQLERAEDERDALRQDAERYQWLRGSYIRPNGNLRVTDDTNIPPGVIRYLDMSLDAAIDAAIKDAQPDTPRSPR